MTLSVFLAGDALLTRRWSHCRNPQFLRLVDEIRGAGTAILNLETVIRDGRGIPQAHSGGIHMSSPPETAAEIGWAGFNLVAHANNHTFDYGSEGVLATIEYLATAGVSVAGSGRDLQEARRPQYHSTAGGTVALVAMAATFVAYGKASESRPDCQGRPGLNPLSLNRGLRSYEGDPHHILEGRTVSKADLAANLAAIQLASANADVVVVSLHAHLRREWLDVFFDQAIAAGADAIFVHGPHSVGAVEKRNGVPIFHSLGSIAFEVEHVSSFPVETYLAAGLNSQAARCDLADPLAGFLPRGVNAYRGLAAVLDFEGGRLGEVRLIPLDLTAPDADDRGRPKMASPTVAEEIISQVRRQSSRFGTVIESGRRSYTLVL